MEEFKKLLSLAWTLGKYYFDSPLETLADYNKFTEKANDLLKPMKPGTKEYNFTRRMLVAVNEYCDADWREKHLGTQMNLYDETK